MSEYQPEEWCLVRVKGNDPHYRVFGSWRGGYVNGDSWRMNSGVVNCIEDGDYYIFEGFSGSTYRCHKKGYGIRSPYNSSVLSEYVTASKGLVEAIETLIETPLRMDWIIGKKRNLERWSDDYVEGEDGNHQD